MAWGCPQCGAARSVGLPAAGAGKAAGRGQEQLRHQAWELLVWPQVPHCPSRRRAGWPSRAARGGSDPWTTVAPGSAEPQDTAAPAVGKAAAPRASPASPAPALTPLLPACCRPPWRRTSPLTAAACWPQAAPPAPAASQAPRCGGTARSVPPPPPRSGAASRSPCAGPAGVAGGPPGSGCGAWHPSPLSPLALGPPQPRGPSDVAVLAGLILPWARRWGCPAPRHAPVGVRCWDGVGRGEGGTKGSLSGAMGLGVGQGPLGAMG